MTIKACIINVKRKQINFHLQICLKIHKMFGCCSEHALSAIKIHEYVYSTEHELVYLHICTY